MIDAIDSSGGSGSVDFKKPRRKKDSALTASKLDREPPHSLEAERGVLGSMLLAPDLCMTECIGKLRVGNAYFYDLRHQTVFEQLVEMYERKDPIDTLTLSQQLKDKN